MSPRLWLWCAFVLCALCSCDASREVERQRYISRVTHPISDVLNIGRLAHKRLPKGESEIRLWVGFGESVLQNLYRLQVDKDGDVSGNAYHYYSLRDTERWSSSDLEQWHSEMRSICTDHNEKRGIYVCKAIASDDQDWSVLHQKISSQGVYTLPDESELPVPKSVDLCGVSITVEVRQGRRYRAYHYKNPGEREEPEAKSADRIIKLVRFRDR